MGLFSQHQFVLDLDCTQFPYKKKQQLRKAVTDNGGVISYILTKKTSFLVASNGAKTADSYKGRTAQKQGVPIVGVSFIEKCVEEGRLLDKDNFLLVGTTANMQFGSGKITTTKTHHETKKPVKISFFNINKFKVWQWGNINSPAFLEDNYEVAKSVLFEKEVRSQERSFYQLELHVIPDDVFDGTSTEIYNDELKYRFRVFIHRGDLHDVMNEDSGIREVMYCESSESAVELYSFLYNQRLKMKRSKRLASRWIGSPRYRQNQLAISGDCDGEMSPEVASLVEGLWKEVIGELEDVLAVDIKTLSAEKVTKAESILLQIKKALDAEDTDDESGSESAIQELSQEFYSQIPHKMHHKEDFKTKSVIAKKQDLCQLIKDIVSVSETTNWSKRSSVESKYRALRCHISCLPVNHPECNDIKNLILSTQGKIWPVKILNIFAVTRPLELTSYNTKLHNSQLLFHASRPANFVGILSRGLVLPKVVVDDFGGERTDAGMLGSGIYFADSFGTSAKYSHISQTTGTRLMAVNQVALGNCHDTTVYQKDLLKPPDGFHSVHGVKHNGTNHSDFKDDEYVVYNTNQQRLRYLIEFSLPDDKPTTLPVCDNEGAKDVEEDVDVDNITEDLSTPIDLSDVQSVENPLTKIKPGLLSNADQPIPLKAVHVRARLLDLAAQVVVLQVYANDSDMPIEAKYVFPLDEQAAVCGFEAFINDKHIVGEVKEKETAHREYKEAISQGHGAYLMDEEKPDVFTVSVGNLPPLTTVVIKITYVAELAVDGDKILFTLPGSVAPWRKDDALAQETQTDVKTVKVNSDTKRALSVHVAVEMPYDIRSLESPTHPIKQKQTAAKATVCLSEKCSGLDDGFQLLIGLAEIHVPRMWAERHPTEKDSQACMLTFYPEFDANSSSQSEVVILLDLSNSMRGGSNLQDAKKLVMLILHHMAKDCKFNIVVFGTDFEELFPQSKVMNKETMKTAQNFMQGLSATMGNTDVWRPLKAYFMLKTGQLRNIFFISDGHVSNEEATLETVRKNCRHTRVFTFGISATANKYLLRAVSNTGAGAFEFFDNKTKSKWEGKVKTQLSRASEPVLSSVNVKWCQFDDDAPTPIQAPNHITSLFSGARQVVYGFVPYCTQATLTATINGHEVSTMVSTHELSITRGKILHQLTARNIIRDWEEGSLATDHTQHEARKAEQKTYIVSLSKKYSIVTQFTSFVAVEVRDENEGEKVRSGVNVTDLLKEEEVDSLKYLNWQNDHSQDAPEETMTIGQLEDFYAIEQCYEECYETFESNNVLDSMDNEEDYMCAYSAIDMGYEEVADAISQPLEDEDIMDTYSLGLPEVEGEYEFPVEAQQAMSKIRRRFFSSEGGKIKGEKKAVFRKEESDSEEDMYDGFCADNEIKEISADYDAVQVEPEQEKPRIITKRHLRGAVKGSMRMDHPEHVKLPCPLKKRTPAVGALMKESNEEDFKKVMPISCGFSTKMLSSIQSEVTCDEKSKKKKKKKAGPKLDEDVRTDSWEASEVQQQPMSNIYSIFHLDLLPELKSVDETMPKGFEKFKKQVEGSNKKKEVTAGSEAVFDSSMSEIHKSLLSGPKASRQSLPHLSLMSYALGSSVEKGPPSLPSPIPSASGLSVTDRGESPVNTTFQAAKQTEASTYGELGLSQQPAMFKGLPPPTPLALRTGSVGFGEAKAGLFGGPPPPPRAIVSVGFGEAKAGLFGGPLPRRPAPRTGGIQDTNAGLFGGPSPPAPRVGRFGEARSLSFGGPPPPLAPPPRAGRFGEAKAGLFGEPSPPPPRAGRFGEAKAGLFGKPPPPAPPPRAGRFEANAGLFGEPPPPPLPPRARRFEANAGLFGEPPPPPLPPRARRFEANAGLFGEPPPPPLPPRAGRFEANAVLSAPAPPPPPLPASPPLATPMAVVLGVVGKNPLQELRLHPQRRSATTSTSRRSTSTSETYKAAGERSTSGADRTNSADKLLMALSTTFEDRLCDIDKDLDIETSVGISDGRTNIDVVMVLLTQQRKAGFWSLGSVFESVVGVRCSYISQMLIDAGVKSLGRDVARLLEQLVTTYLVILCLNKVLNLSSTRHFNSKERESTVEAVVNAERWVAQVERDHPSMARRLELGSSWHEVCTNIFNGGK
ncbi:protein mono-ADP-ribosyltransferase PARP4-like isoform X2 [Asterias amurensis]|uniref:protein mono-ADP-ribosyltransferase PARP4-like isoform X2 n=1 Tax=Asterias amurensis TaxID=7602 RepID=UPI003AB2B191